jgi:hypothetical protein
VSYVPPVYYADRLCERARAYVRGVTVTAPKDIDCPVRPTKEEKDTDQQWKAKKKDWDGKMKTWGKAIVEEWKKRDEWKEIVGGKITRTNPVGPWHPALNYTMFWM